MAREYLEKAKKIRDIYGLRDGGNGALLRQRIAAPTTIKAE
jgi:hypothetical protein